MGGTVGFFWEALFFVACGDLSSSNKKQKGAMEQQKKEEAQLAKKGRKQKNG